MTKTIRAAKNGCGGGINLCGIAIYHVFEPLGELSMSELGTEQYKDAFIRSRVSDETDVQLVKNMLVDWRLYEHGWLVSVDDSGRYRNENLFYYKCQMGNYGSHVPEALKLLQHVNV